MIKNTEAHHKFYRGFILIIVPIIYLISLNQATKELAKIIE